MEKLRSSDQFRSAQYHIFYEVWDASKDDLFGDQGVVKTQLKEGSGWKTPKVDDEVLLSLKAEAADGSVVEQRTDLEYVIGSDALGSLARAVDMALIGMKRGEDASLKCSKDYTYSEKPEGVTLSLTLKELYVTKDVSFAQDKSVMKKQVKKGEGYDMPKDGSAVKLSVVAATDGAAAIPGFLAQVLEFPVGNGDVCDALECAVLEMKKGERATVTVAAPALAADAQLGLKDVAADTVVLTVELMEFEKSKSRFSMTEDEMASFSSARKELGTQLFKAGRVALALQRYKKVAELCSNSDSMQKKANKMKAKGLKRVSELNMAACYFHLKDYDEAKKACVLVHRDEKSNVKALFIAHRCLPHPQPGKDRRRALPPAEVRRQRTGGVRSHPREIQLVCGGPGRVSPTRRHGQELKSWLLPQTSSRRTASTLRNTSKD